MAAVAVPVGFAEEDNRTVGGMGMRFVAVGPDSVKITYDATNKVWRATMTAAKDELKSSSEFKY